MIMSSPIAPSRDLLFGLLALQNGLIDQVQLVAAFQAWTLDKTRALADHLIALGHLNGAQKAVVEAMADLHVAKHGDVERSLAAISAGRSTQESLARLGDPDIERTLGHVQPRSTQQNGEADADRTATYSEGAATSDGLRFRVLRPHARGGLGVVFVALDQELHREVALKQILDQHADDPISRQRFLLEAEVTGCLEHPGIVPVYSLGTQPDGRPYYAMRFIRGDSLKEAIEQFHADEGLEKESGQRSLELRNLLKRFTDVCNAIEYAHSRGVLHRDIKPGNIIVGKHGETLVVDWGLAKAQGRIEPGLDSGERTLVPSSASGSASTLPGSALGTPAYMSPEQAEGDLERLGPRSDVYSLGATLYCLLVGKPPFEGDLAEVIRGVQKGVFPPPRQVDPSIDQALEAVCLKAMALKPADRYASPRALADDVERCMADEPVTAWREPLARRARRWARQRRTGVTAVAIAVLLAFMGTAAVLAVQTRANRELKRANSDLAVANDKVTRANADLAASNQRERARFALAQEAIRTFHTGVSEDILLKQEEFKALRTRLLQGAREFYRKLEDLLQGSADRDSRLALGRAYYEVGELSRQLDSIEEAQEILRRAMVLFETLSLEDPADQELQYATARTLRSLATTLSGVGRKKEALAAVARSRDLFRALSEAQPGDRRRRAEWAQSEILYAAHLDTDHRLAEALEGIQRARSILGTPVQVDPATHEFAAELMEVYGAQALILRTAGRVDEAIASYKKARDIGEALFLAKPEDATTSHELVRTLGNMGLALGDRPVEALAAFDRARVVIKAAGALNPTLILFPAASAWIETAAADALASLGRNEEALAALERSREAREILIKANPSVTRTREMLARGFRQTADIQHRAGRLHGALTALERMSQVVAGLADDHPQNRDYQIYLAWAYVDLGGLHDAMGKPSEASSCFDKAIAIRRKMIAADPSTPSYRSDLATTFRHRGLAMQKSGRPADAARDFRQSIAVFQSLTKPTPGDFYDLACVQSLISGIAAKAGSGLTSDEGRAAAEQAITTLHRAFDAGWNNPAWMRNDHDLDPIRSRPDFQLLMMKMMDRAFPAEPFSKQTSADR
jgi:eukaryotic-like serine/threonine-protein kinase